MQSDNVCMMFIFRILGRHILFCVSCDFSCCNVILPKQINKTYSSSWRIDSIPGDFIHILCKELPTAIF